METITQRFLTVQEFSTYLNFSPRHIYNLVAAKKYDQLPIKPLRIGKGPKAAVRFDRVALDKWIADQS